jgi:hypothetical protein
MKRKISLGFFVITATILLEACGGGKPGGSTSSPNNEERDFKTMVVEFQSNTAIMGMKVIVNEIQWIDQKNNKEATLTTTKTTGLGMTQKEEKLSITDGDWAYSIDLVAKTGTKANTKETKDMALAMGAAMAMGKNLDFKSLKEFVEKNGGKMNPNETFLGKDCMSYEMMGMKFLQYRGVVVKTTAGDLVSRVAVKIDENVSIPSERFEVPNGITITEVPGLGDLGNQ